MSKRAIEKLLLDAIVAEAEQSVKRVTAYMESHAEWRVADVEPFLMSEGRRMVGRLLGAMLMVYVKENEGDGRCPDCDATMRNKGMSERECQTLVGTIRWRRRYWYCQACRKGHYLLDEARGLSQERMSKGCLSALGQLAASLPFEQAAALLERLSGVIVSGRHLGRAAEKVGCEIRQRRMEEEQKLTQQDWNRKPTEPERPWAVSLDAAKVRFRDGWHEVKVVVASGVLTQGDQVRAVDPSYGVELGNMETTGRRLYGESLRRGVDPIRDEVVCVADGAPGNWRQFEAFFENRCEILDWYHAMEHLWAAGRGCFGEGTDETADWVEERKAELWSGQVDQNIEQLQLTAQDEACGAAAQQVHYFQANRHRMDYATYRARGFPIGSGLIESACKRVIIGRARQSGMTWTQSGLEAVLTLRAELLSGRWEEAWMLTDRSLA